MELVKLYGEVKSGEIDPQVAGRLTHILSVLLSSARDHVMDDRIAAIEARLASVKPNGHAVNSPVARR
jgi:hypothetical protein